MSKHYLSLGVLLIASNAPLHAAGDVVRGTYDPTSQVVNTKPTDGIYNLGGTKLIDRNLEVTGQIYTHKDYELVGVSTPATPSTGHARVFLSSSTHQLCTVFDDAGVSCGSTSGSPAITSITGGDEIYITGTSVAPIVNLSSSIVISTLTVQSPTANGNAVATFQNTTVASGARDDQQIAVKLVGDIVYTSAPVNQGPPFASNLAGETFRTTSEPFSGLTLYGSGSLVVRTPSWVLENTTNGGLIWGINMDYLNHILIGDPTSNGRQHYWSLNQLDVYGNLGIGADYHGVSTAPVNGAMIEGDVLIGTNVINSSYKQMIMGTSQTDLGVIDKTASATSRIDLGIPGSDFTNAMTLARGGASTTGNVFGRALANANVVEANSTGDLLIGTIGTGGVTLGMNNLERVRIDATGITLKSSVTFSPTTIGIVGTTTNDSAGTGLYGEYLSSAAANVNFPSNGVWGDITSVSLSAGDWRCNAKLTAHLQGATMTTFNVGIGTTAGNTDPGTLGINKFQYTAPTANNDASGGIFFYRVSLSGAATLYTKYYSDYSAGGPPRAWGGTECTRIR